MLGNLIGGFIVVVIGVNLIPTVADEVQAAQWQNATQPTNLTGSAATILDLVTLFFALGILSAGIAIAAQGLRAAGLLGV